MPTIITKDTLRASVEAATGGACTVLYDSGGFANYMRIIPKFNCEDIDASLGTGVHPAFMVGGVEKSEIFVSQYLAVEMGGLGVSQPGMYPNSSGASLSAIRTKCANKGAGWHLMSNWEWAAIALICVKNGTIPRGNSNYGRSHLLPHETGRRYDGGTPGAVVADNEGSNAIIYNGSGSASWRHDHTFAGISDLVGNNWHLLDGMKLVEGQIVMTPDNHYDLPEASWANSGIFFDVGSIPPADRWSASSEFSVNGVTANTMNAQVDGGVLQLAESIINRSGTSGSDALGNFAYRPIAEITASLGGNDSAKTHTVKRSSILPYAPATNPAGGNIAVRNYGTRSLVRGGWFNGGLFGDFYMVTPLANPGFFYRPVFIL